MSYIGSKLRLRYVVQWNNYGEVDNKTELRNYRGSISRTNVGAVPTKRERNEPFQNYLNYPDHICAQRQAHLLSLLLFRYFNFILRLRQTLFEHAIARTGIGNCKQKIDEISNKTNSERETRDCTPGQQNDLD